MAKTGEINISYHPEKLDAIDTALEDKGLCLTDELTKSVDALYIDNVHKAVKRHIAKRLGEEPPPKKEKKTRKNKAAPGKPEGENDVT